MTSFSYWLPALRLLFLFSLYLFQLGVSAQLTYSKDNATITCTTTEVPNQVGVCNCTTAPCYELELKGLGLTSIRPGAFNSLSDLTSLRLSNNAFETLSPDTFGPMPNLRELDLSNNSIKTLPPAFFSNIPRLTRLDLSFNPLTLLPSDALPATLQRVQLLGTSLSCCTALQLRTHLPVWGTDIGWGSTCSEGAQAMDVKTALAGFISGNLSASICDPCSNTPCHVDATCYNEGSNYVCVCNKGWTGSGGGCTDLDECTLKLHSCQQTCSSTPGSFVCGCNHGFRLASDGRTCEQCEPVYGCKLGMSVCESVGGSTCRVGECEVGFEGLNPSAPSTCRDTDECANKKPCPQTQDGNFTCVNAPGSFFCHCSPGFFAVGDRCIDVNECLDGDLNRCPQRSALCDNTVGSYNCVCNFGYKGNGTVCEDIDECASGVHDCSVNATCHNIEGFYICKCNMGFVGGENDTCQACMPLPNCDVTLCGPPLEDEVKGALFTDMTSNITQPGTDVMPDNSSNTTTTPTKWPFRCRSCSEGYFITDDLRCSKCSSTDSCLTVKRNCSENKDMLCDTCPMGFSGLVCDKEDVNVTMVPGYVVSEPALEVLRVALKDVLGISNDETIQVNGFTTLSNSNQIVVLMKIKRPYVDLLYDKATKSYVLGQLNITEVSTLRKGVQDVIGPEAIGVLETSRGYITIAVTVGLVLAVIAVAVVGTLAFIYHRRRRPRSVEEMIAEIKKSHKWTEVNTEEAAAVLRHVKGKSGWLPRSQFVILERLGSGAFGSVSKGVLFSDGVAALCAVKELKEGSAKSYAEFIREATLLKELNHDNIVNLLGLSADDEPPQADGAAGVPSNGIYILLEYMTLGDLRHYLLSRGDTITWNLKVWIAYQVSQGLAYLTSKGVVHRDVAARNILLSDPGADTRGYPVVKVSDMGLARVTGIDRQYVKEGDGLLPIRWMPPESITDSIYTEASDVWSFGVTLWEIASNGAMPYAAIKSHQLLSLLEQGHRLDCPPNCTKRMFLTMLKCWAWHPRDRPTFAELVEDMMKQVAPEDLEKGTQPFDIGGSGDSSKMLLTRSSSLRQVGVGSDNNVHVTDVGDGDVYPGYAWIDRPTRRQPWLRMPGAGRGNNTSS